jgi:hypothetical protein
MSCSQFGFSVDRLVSSGLEQHEAFRVKIFISGVGHHGNMQGEYDVWLALIGISRNI